MQHPRQHARRGVALMLVLVAVAMATILGVAFLNAQATSTGIAQRVDRHAVARHIAESALVMGIRYVEANADWRSEHAHGPWIVDQPLLNGTFTLLGEDDDGDLADDASDSLTLTAIGAFEGVTHVVRAEVTPGNSGGEALLVYGEQGEPVVRFRDWIGAAWSSERSAEDVGNNPQWTVAQRCPKREEFAVLTLDSTKKITAQFRVDGTWAEPTIVSHNCVTSSDRPMDLAYEQQSGELLMVYRVNSDASRIHYRTWDGSTLSPPSHYDLPMNGAAKFIKLVPRPGGDEVMLVVLDDNRDVAAAVWDGGAWTNAIALENNAAYESAECIAAAYEGLTGNAVVAWSQNNLDTFQYRTWDGADWSDEADGPVLDAEVKWMKMASDPAGNRIFMGTLHGNRDIQLIEWNGSGWGSPLVVETNAPASDRRHFDLAFAYGGTRALAVWGSTGQSRCFYRVFDGANWSNEVAGPSLSDVVSIAQLTPGVRAGEIFVTVLGRGSGALHTMLWDGDELSEPVEVEANLAGASAHEAFAVASTGSISAGGDARIIALYEFKEVKPEPALIGHWKLDEPAGGAHGNTTAFAMEEKTDGDRTIATKITLDSPLTASSIVGYVKGPPPKLLRFAIFSDDDGEPGELIVQSDDEPVGANAMYWHEIAIEPTELQAGDYWLAMTFEHSNMYYAYEAGGESRSRSSAYTNGYPANWGASNDALNRRVSIYLGSEVSPAVDEVGGGGAIYRNALPGASGVINTAAQFNGDDSYIEILHDDAYLLNSGTVAFWFNADALTSLQGLLSREASDDAESGHLHIYTDGNRLKVRLQKHGVEHTVIAAGTLSANSWYHVAVTFGPDGMRVYRDGVAVGAGTTTGAMADTPNGPGNREPIVLGADASGSDQHAATPLTNFFAGRIDDVRLYDKQLDADQVTDLYHGHPLRASSRPSPIVHETSGVDSPADLWIDDLSRIQWMPGGGLTFEDATRAVSLVPATKLHDRLAAGQAFTLEVQFTPANVTQNGPARIVSYSLDNGERNFTLGQEWRQGSMRLRTSSGNANGTPAVATGDVLAAGVMQHLIVTFDGETLRLYHNGALASSESRSGDLSTWSVDHWLVLGNEAADDAPWLGTFHRVAIYDKALTAAQASNVSQGLEPGAAGNAPSNFAYRWIEE